MNTLAIHVFKDSFNPIIELLDENDLAWSMREQRPELVMSSSGIIEVALNASAWVSIASVLIAFIKARHGRKVMITTEENQVIHAEGLTPKELEKVLEKADWVVAIDPDRSNQ